MRLANSWLILACIAAAGGFAGADNALAQASDDRQAVDLQHETVTDTRGNSDVADEKVPAPAADVGRRAGQDRSDVGPIRWMAPESLSEKVVTAPADGAPAQDADSANAQTRDRDDEGRTDKSEAARARRIRGEPCGIPPVASDPSGVAAGAVSTPGASATTQGCGNP